MPFPSEPKPWSFYRLGPTKEKELFKRHRDTYDGVVIPAHIASYYSKFCSEFIGTLGKPYFIDPLTFIFSNDSSQIRRFVKDKNTGRTKRDRFGNKKKGDVKRSYLKLVENEYCEKIKEVVEENRSLNPNDFADSKIMEQFVNKVVQFQLTKLAAIPDKYKKYEKYAKMSGRDMSVSGNPPMCLVAPYFPITTLNARGWYPTNIKLIQATKATSGTIPTFAVVLADTTTLAQHSKQIAEDYSKAGTDGYLLWPDGFSSDQDTAALRIIFDSVTEFSQTGKPVILMYGDAFSLSLHYAGLAGFACGICYGEKKLSTQDVDIEGGIPPRYYIRRLKKKVQIETEARRIQIDQYPDLACTCEICQRKPDPVTLDDAESREHFMLTRAQELIELRNGLTRQQYAGILRDAYEEHKNDLLLQPIGHLRNWADILGAGNNE